MLYFPISKRKRSTTHLQETGFRLQRLQMTDMQCSSSNDGQVLGTNQEAADTKLVRIVPSDFLAELQSAASMVMSREECAEIAKEIEKIRNPHRAAA